MSQNPYDVAREERFRIIADGEFPQSTPTSEEVAIQKIAAERAHVLQLSLTSSPTSASKETDARVGVIGFFGFRSSKVPTQSNEQNKNPNQSNTNTKKNKF